MSSHPKLVCAWGEILHCTYISFVDWEYRNWVRGKIKQKKPKYKTFSFANPRSPRGPGADEFITCVYKLCIMFGWCTTMIVFLVYMLGWNKSVDKYLRAQVSGCVYCKQKIVVRVECVRCFHKICCTYFTTYIHVTTIGSFE